jgi:hypothetical protein
VGTIVLNGLCPFDEARQWVIPGGESGPFVPPG